MRLTLRPLTRRIGGGAILDMTFFSWDTDSSVLQAFADSDRCQSLGSLFLALRFDGRVAISSTRERDRSPDETMSFSAVSSLSVEIARAIFF